MELGIHPVSYLIAPHKIRMAYSVTAPGPESYSDINVSLMEGSSRLCAFDEVTRKEKYSSCTCFENDFLLFGSG
jgi:hypothetical protein